MKFSWSRREHVPGSAVSLRSALGVLAAALVLGASGCGKSLQTGASPSDINHISVAAATDGTIPVGQTKRFQAVAAAANGQAVATDYAWSVDPPTIATAIGQGVEVLVTGRTPGTGTLYALAANGIKGRYTIVVTAGAVSDVRVEPMTDGKTSVEAGETLGFRATAVDLGGNAVGQSRSRVVISPAWSVEGPIGTITNTGDFTGSAVGIGKTGQIVATVEGVVGTMNLTVTVGSRALYVGAETCKGCHAEQHAEEMRTHHATAFIDLKAAGADKNPECVRCHTVGYGKGGFISEADSPQFANVQCENCHGPGSQHVAANGDKSKIVTGTAMLSSAVCGQCHVTENHPTFEEWEKSPHAEMTEDVAANVARGSNAGCAACHGAVARHEMRAGRPAPTGPDAASMGVTCQTCHDPHGPTSNDYHLRYPLASTAFYTLNYNAPVWNDSIQVCGQCHNNRNASYTSSGRPPHHSPQYNMLVGDQGPEATSGLPSAPGSALSAHRNIDKQCAHCHMFHESQQTPTAANRNNTGHAFRADFRACEPCHTAADAGARAAATQTDVRQRLEALQARLDTWATTLSPTALRTKYGKLAWEFTTPGVFGNPSGVSTVVGPSSTEQSTIPAAVKKARFALYLVMHDGSYGVHNARYARFMLDQANTQLDSINVPR